MSVSVISKANQNFRAVNLYSTSCIVYIRLVDSNGKCDCLLFILL